MGAQEVFPVPVKDDVIAGVYDWLVLNEDEVRFLWNPMVTPHAENVLKQRESAPTEMMRVRAAHHGLQK